MQNDLSKRCWRDDEGVDRISKLPQARIFQILSLLPQRDVVTTSVLSKRWNAPCLKYLMIKGIRDIQLRLVEMIANNTSDEDLLRIRIVSLSSRSSLISEIAFPKYTIFHQLVYLELYTSQAIWCNLLTLIINTSPRLQVLKLIGCEWDYRKVSSGRWNQPKNVPECLETFVWNCCKEQQEKEKGVANYILRNANRLKKAKIIMKEFNAQERLKMLEEFKSVVKASNSSCNILVVE
ncbi:unnamed protein product [Brassica oleracea]